MEIVGRKALVMGAARSGIASARFLVQRGATVALNDQKHLAEWAPAALALKTEGVAFVEGEPPSWLLDQIDLVVVSPGVPTKAIPIRYADRRGAEVIGEVELASRFLRGRTVAITGSNGKTTTTSLIGEMLKDAGIKVQVGGNIGTALVSMIDSSHDDGWNVVELSSFQLETIVDFHPEIAAGLACGAAPESLRDTVRRFQPVEHRLEEVAEVNRVRFVNDSKATSVDATMKALEAFADESGKVVLILGGRGKQAPYAPLTEL